MSIGILLITHPGVGSSMLHTATRILGYCPLQTKCLEVPAGSDPDAVACQARRQLDKLDQGDGVLILTDLFGSTPSNIAQRLAESNRAAVVAGLNLPMLIRLYNYPADDLSSLSRKVDDGAIRGILRQPPPDRD